MRTIIILLLVYIAYRVIKGYFYFKEGIHPGRQRQEGARDEVMVQDPVCKSFIPVSTALALKDGDRVEYFCGPECRDKRLESRSR